MPHSSTLVAAFVVGCGIAALGLALIWALCGAAKKGDEDQQFGPLFSATFRDEDPDARYFVASRFVVDGRHREQKR